MKDLRFFFPALAVVVMLTALDVHGQNWRVRLSKADSLLADKYNKSSGLDSSYIVRPATRWTVKGRLNVSGSGISAEGRSSEGHFLTDMDADFKATASVAVSYVGVSLGMALNPGKLSGRYKDYEFNLNSYSNRFGFDVIYQNSQNFKGTYESDLQPRINITTDLLKLQSLNVNVYYAFNHHRFSYPAAFSQSYIQKRSAGSWLLALSLQGQRTDIEADEEMGTESAKLETMNIGLGGGYGYNFVPSKNWLFHISALPTFVVYSHASLRYNDEKVPLRYHFPEMVITGRGAVVRQFGKKYFAGLSLVFTFTNIGDSESLSVQNLKWRHRLFFGYRF